MGARSHSAVKGRLNSQIRENGSPAVPFGTVAGELSLHGVLEAVEFQLFLYMECVTNARDAGSLGTGRRRTAAGHPGCGRSLSGSSVHRGRQRIGKSIRRIRATVPSGQVIGICAPYNFIFLYLVVAYAGC